MKKFRITGVMLAIALLAAHAIAPAQTAPVANAALAMQASFAGHTVAPNATLLLSFAEPVAVAPGRFAVMVGSEDVTVHFARLSPTELRGVFAEAPLPAGEAVLKLYRIDDGGTWQLLAEAPLSVQPTAPVAGGASRSVVKPSATLSIDARGWAAHSAAAPAPERSTFADATLQFGLDTDHGDGDFGLTSSTRFAGTRHVDLASYLIEGQRRGGALGTSRIALGHVNAGDHPLLASAIANRGLLLRQQLGERADLMWSSQDGSAPNGSRNISGLADAANRLNVASVGYDMLARAGGLRVELTGFSGTVRPVAAPGSSPPPSAATSHGWGVRLHGASEDNRWRGEVAYAVSSGGGIAAGGAHRAYLLDLSRELLQGLVLSPTLADYPLSLTASVRSERTEPGYQSLGASLTADSASTTAALRGSLGPVTGSIEAITRHDNLRRDPAAVRKRSPSLAVRADAPLATLIAAQAPSAWWPALDFSVQRQREFDDRGLLPAGKTPADLQDGVTTTHTLGLNWLLPSATVAYAYSRIASDNRQPGHEAADTLDTRHELKATRQFGDALSVNASLGWRRGAARDSGSSSRGLDAAAGAQWSFGARWALSATASLTVDRERPLPALRRSVVADLNLVKQFDVTVGGAKRPCQGSLHYAINQNSARDATQPAATTVRHQTLNLGFSLAY